MLSADEAVRLVYMPYVRVRHLLHGFDSHTRTPEASRELLARLDLATNVPVIAVTGSKGKGSTSLLAAAMLQSLGHRVGLVTSPHHVNFMERIRVDGIAIAEADFVRIMNEFAPAIHTLTDELPSPTYIGSNGIILACALRYFQEQNVTAIVLEAGRGGRFDEMRLLDNHVTCISPIMAEHLDKLGPTVRDVAWNKAGLIKPHSVAVSAPQSPEVAVVLQAEARLQQAQLLRVGQEVMYWQRRTANDSQEIGVCLPETANELRFRLHSPAPYQAINVAVAAAAVQALLPDSAPTAMTKRVEQLRLPGRAEKVADNPTVIIDGAINRQSAQLFLESVPVAKRPTVLITALPQDKDFTGLLSVLVPRADHVIITQANNPVLHFDDRVLRAANALAADVRDIPQSADAFTTGLELAGKNGAIWVVGTQSLVRDALQFWQQSLDSIWLDDSASDIVKA